MTSKIGLITYDYPHLKTEQIFSKLMGKNMRNEFVFYALPFVPRKGRTVLFSHRPDQSHGMIPLKLAEKYEYQYVKCDSDLDIDSQCEFYLILGAGLLSAQCVKTKKIINCHPGIIPLSRGLDAFKWAIFDMIPVGNTLHYIDQEVDAGEIISIISTPVYATDSLESFSQRHYANEIQMMVDFENYLHTPVNPYQNMEIGVPHMRMNYETERELLGKFEQYKLKFAVK